MLTPSSGSEHAPRPLERAVLTSPKSLFPEVIPLSANIAEGVRRLRGDNALPAVEVPKGALPNAPLLAGYVSDCNEFSLLYDGRDSAAFRAYFEKHLRYYGFPRDDRSCVIEHISRLFDDFRDATESGPLEAFLIVRRPRARAHWHIDHYRPEALQFVTTLTGYPNTPFLLPQDYDRGEFERYRLRLLERETERRTLSYDDDFLHSLKTSMSQLGEGPAPRCVKGDLLFKGEELFHASPKNPVSRMIFALSAVCSESPALPIPRGASSPG